MPDRRLSDALSDAVRSRSLSGPSAGRAGPLDPVPAPPAIGASLGIGRESPAKAGIASPLTETKFSDRKYHETTDTDPPSDPEVVYSSDGIFSIQLKRLKTLTMTDANGRPVQFVYKKPKPPETP